MLRHAGGDTVFIRGSTNTEPGAVATGSNTPLAFVMLDFLPRASLYVESMTRRIDFPPEFH